MRKLMLEYLKSAMYFQEKMWLAFYFVPLLLLDSIQTSIKIKMVYNPKNC